MSMYDPPHPGGVIKEFCLPAAGLTIKAAAAGLCMSPRALSRIINGRAPITADIALRLSEAFGSSPEMWLRMQQAYDLWQARHNMERPAVTKYRSQGEIPTEEEEMARRLEGVA